MRRSPHGPPLLVALRFGGDFVSRRFLFALSLFLALLLVPSRAFAWDVQPKGVLYSTDLDGSRVGYVVSAYNQYDAACYALGKDPNTISSAVKEKLSDSNYGGRFYDYAESFFTQSGGLENVPTWVPAYVILVSELGDLVLSDYQGVWYSTATSSLYDGAMVDFVAILNGEDLGGGDSGGGAVVSSSFPSSITLDTTYGVYVNGNHWTDSKISVYGSQTVYFSNSSALYSWVSARGLNYFYLFNAPRQGRNNGKAASPNIVMYASASPIEFSFSTASGNIPRVTIVATSDSNIWYSGSYSSGSYGSVFYNTAPQLSGSFTYTYDYLPLSEQGTTVSYSPTWGSGNSTRYVTYVAYNGAPVVVPPSGDWPVAPSVSGVPAPVLPEPSSPVLEPEPDVPTVTPTWPQVTINVEPAPTDTTPQDYTPWLSSILTSINSMRGELLLEFDGLVDVVRNVFNAVLNLGNVMEEHCVHIRNKLEECVVSLENYMRSLVHWLADQLRYDADVTGDSDVFGVLSSIDSKLGGGTYEPNPLASELAYYGWNDDLWNRFLLGDNWETSVSGMTQDMGRLTTRFPFSIPWDVVALFRLFVHDPVTPVFDLPLYFSSDGYSTVHVDLSSWDSVAALVRPLVFVIFALKLALLSRDLLSGFFGGD